MRVFLPVFGVGIYATTTVVCSFMAGLGLGSLAAPGLIKKWKKPLPLLYALLSITAGISAVAVPFLAGPITRVYASIPEIGNPSLLAPFTRFILSFAAMCIPTFLMGTTLPVLAQVCAGNCRNTPGAKRIGLLYGLNTAGGACGAVLAGFLLIFKLGLKITTAATASVSCLLGLSALLLASNNMENSVTGHKAPPLPFSPRKLILLYAAIGAISLSYELIWTRILVFYLQSATYSFSIILAVYLSGIALGSICFAGKGTFKTAGILQLLIGISGIATLHFYCGLGEIWKKMILLFGANTWGMITLQKIFITGLIVLPPAFLMGAMFSVLAGLHKTGSGSDSKTIGHLCAANTLGAVAGTLFTGFILFNTLGVQSTLLLVSALSCLAGIIFLSQELTANKALRLVTAGLVSIYGLVIFMTPEGMLAANYARYKGEILFFRESASDITIVHRVRKNYLELAYHDGRGTASTIPVFNYLNRLDAYIPMAVNPEAEDVLVICMGAGNTAGAFSSFPIKSLDIVDISPGCFEAAKYFSTNNGVLLDSRVRTYIEDGRNFLLRTKKQYDIIESEPPSIHTDAVVYLYTREFYQAVYSRLRNGGVFAQWIDANQCGRDNTYALINTMLDVFPNSSLWAYSNKPLDGLCLVVGIKGKRKTRVDYRKASRLFSDPRVSADLKSVNTNLDDILMKFYSSGDRLQKLVGKAFKITDDRTIVDFAVPMVKRPAAFGGGLAYTGSPLEKTLRHAWSRDISANPVRIPVTSEQDTSRVPLDQIVEGLPVINSSGANK